MDEHQSCIALHQQPDRRSRWPERSWPTIDNRTFTIRGADGVGQSRTIGSAEELNSILHEHFGLVFHAGGSMFPAIRGRDRVEPLTSAARTAYTGRSDSHRSAFDRRSDRRQLASA